MGEAGAPLVKHYTENTEAYNAYLLGRYRWNKRGENFQQTDEDLMAAMKHFKEAIALDPNYALAYSGLADVYNFLPMKIASVKKSDVKAQAEEVAKKALALDPNLAEAHASMGRYKDYFLKDFKGAEREFQRAIELNPKYAPTYHFYASVLYLTDRLDESLNERRKAYELDPFSAHYSFMLGITLLVSRQYDVAINQLQRSLELDSNNATTWLHLGAAYLHAKKYEDATREYVHWAELTGENKEAMQHYVSLVEEHKRTGKPVSATPELEIIFAKLNWTRFLYANLGQKEKTLEALEQAYEEEKYYPLYLLHFDFLRKEPRFIVLERKRKQILGLD